MPAPRTIKINAPSAFTSRVFPRFIPVCLSENPEKEEDSDEMDLQEDEDQRVLAEYYPWKQRFLEEAHSIVDEDSVEHADVLIRCKFLKG